MNIFIINKYMIFITLLYYIVSTNGCIVNKSIKTRILINNKSRFSVIIFFVFKSTHGFKFNES